MTRTALAQVSGSLKRLESVDVAEPASSSDRSLLSYGSSGSNRDRESSSRSLIHASSLVSSFDFSLDRNDRLDRSRDGRGLDQSSHLRTTPAYTAPEKMQGLPYTVKVGSSQRL